MKIGVFDSGLGGEAVAEALRQLLPDSQIVSINDRDNMPYGSKPRAEIMKLTVAAVKPLITIECDVIVIACNTATTAAIQLLRHDYPMQKFIGLEPMIKPAAALTTTKTIAVLATPATLSSPRYKELKDEYGHGVKIIEPDCSPWAEQIELGNQDEINLNETLKTILQNKVDVIVLGCTHYHWLKEKIQDLAGPNVTILEPSDAIRNRIVEITM